MNSNSFKFCKASVAAVLLFSVFTWFGMPAEARAQNCTESVKVEKINAAEWKIIDRDGQFAGTLKSENLQSFLFYDIGGQLVGTIFENGSWQPRLYRSRNTLIMPEEARLFLDALDAIAIVKAGNPQSGAY